MKVRNGFVSNSSSSSFVVCVNDEVNLEQVVNNVMDIIYIDEENGTPSEARKYVESVVNDIWEKKSFYYDIDFNSIPKYIEDFPPETGDFVNCFGGQKITEVYIPTSDYDGFELFTKSQLQEIINKV